MYVRYLLEVFLVRRFEDLRARFGHRGVALTLISDRGAAEVTN